MFLRYPFLSKPYSALFHNGLQLIQLPYLFVIANAYANAMPLTGFEPTHYTG
jgi:hypothetical protein